MGVQRPRKQFVSKRHQFDCTEFHTDRYNALCVLTVTYHQIVVLEDLPSITCDSDPQRRNNKVLPSNPLQMSLRSKVIKGIRFKMPPHR
jgi:hypothetical protein